MKTRWLVTPYFFDVHDSALFRAVPDQVDHAQNDPGGVLDRAPQSLARTHRPIAEFVQSAIQQDEVPVSIAGDCAASLPVMAGLQKAGLDPVLVWLDAHGDFNTIETSPSGFLGGMPLAMMVGRGDLSLAAQTGQQSIAESDVWLIDARDLDPLEEKALTSSEVNHLPFERLRDLRFKRPVHLHIDNDVIDAMDVPANNYPVGAGPRLDDVVAHCVTFAAQNTICAISFSGWNGELDKDGKTATACATLLSEITQALR